MRVEQAQAVRQALRSASSIVRAMPTSGSSRVFRSRTSSEAAFHRARLSALARPRTADARAAHEHFAATARRKRGRRRPDPSRPRPAGLWRHRRAPPVRSHMGRIDDGVSPSLLIDRRDTFSSGRST